MSELVHTKLLVETRPAKFLSLGFGDIASSEADLVCVSAFNEDAFTPNSAIGAIDRVLGRGVLEKLLPGNEQQNQHCTLLDLQNQNVAFRHLLIVWMGDYDQFVEHRNAETMIQAGLQSSLRLIAALPGAPQIDAAALGTQYGGVHRRRAFDLTTAWALDLFKVCPRVNHVRLVAFSLDTFVDFFEALYRLKNCTGNELVFGESVDWNQYGAFRNDVTTAAKILDENPKQVLVICRTVVESVIRLLCQQCLHRTPSLLFEDIKQLHDGRFLPEHINSFFHTCRVVGNFANHTEFNPSRRDAEAVMLLTLRIVEWFLNEAQGKSTVAPP